MQKIIHKDPVNKYFYYYYLVSAHNYAENNPQRPRE